MWLRHRTASCCWGKIFTYTKHVSDKGPRSYQECIQHKKHEALNQQNYEHFSSTFDHSPQDIQIKFTIVYHFIVTRMAKIYQKISSDA